MSGERDVRSAVPARNGMLSLVPVIAPYADTAPAPGDHAVSRSAGAFVLTGPADGPRPTVGRAEVSSAG
ncbi:hypothetical protein ABZX30_27045 [Streptomyces sp. NPDC004542]|uniref:hypothetical protein n=1 Tax=Streptomyces sp. NPDC004542 TaxID=3154281 RepID=UPI0033B48049